MKPKFVMGIVFLLFFCVSFKVSSMEKDAIALEDAKYESYETDMRPWSGLIGSNVKYNYAAPPRTEKKPIDPRPLPNIRIPHSERTKQNVVDILLDLAFERLFKSYEGLKIEYSFFEFSYVTKNLIFTDFVITFNMPKKIIGTFKANKLEIGIKELYMYVKDDNLTLNTVNVKDAQFNADIINEKGKKTKVEATAKLIDLKQAILSEYREPLPKGETPTDWVRKEEVAFLVEKVSIADVFLKVLKPKETYKAQALSINNFKLQWIPTFALDFTEAFKDGHDVYSFEDLKKILKK